MSNTLASDPVKGEVEKVFRSAASNFSENGVHGFAVGEIAPGVIVSIRIDFQAPIAPIAPAKE